MRDSIQVSPWRDRRPLERTLLSLLCRVLLAVVILLVMRALVLKDHPWAAIGATVMLSLAVLYLFEGAQDRRRRRMEIREAHFRAWLAKMNRAASVRGYHDFDFNGDAKELRWYYDEGLTPEQALTKAERDL